MRGASLSYLLVAAVGLDPGFRRAVVNLHRLRYPAGAFVSSTMEPPLRGRIVLPAREAGTGRVGVQPGARLDPESSPLCGRAGRPERHHLSAGA
jgi:hypothetical protein